MYWSKILWQNANVRPTTQYKICSHNPKPPKHISQWHFIQKALRPDTIPMV